MRALRRLPAYKRLTTYTTATRRARLLCVVGLIDTSAALNRARPTRSLVRKNEIPQSAAKIHDYRESA
ncbi:MAG TPA: hypothetical protein VJT82_10185 [Pyrinomonadaceae bacterium]|nr:hypothetical protein [Pyrinomonadaceae bacterium]